MVEVVNGLNTLIDYRYQQHFKAERGGNGMGKDRHGANGKDVVLGCRSARRCTRKMARRCSPTSPRSASA